MLMTPVEYDLSAAVPKWNPFPADDSPGRTIFATLSGADEVNSDGVKPVRSMLRIAAARSKSSSSRSRSSSRSSSSGGRDVRVHDTQDELKQDEVSWHIINLNQIEIVIFLVKLDVSAQA